MPIGIRVWAATMGVNLLRLWKAMCSCCPRGRVALNREISALYQGHDGRLWVGTEGGLACWNEKAWQTFTTNNGLSANIISAIADDSDGDVWVGTEHGGLDLMRGGKVTVFQKAAVFPATIFPAFTWMTAGCCGLGPSATACFASNMGS